MRNKKITKKRIVNELLNNKLNNKEQKELKELLLSKSIVIDIDKESDSNIKLGDRIADKVSEIVGSWRFIIIFVSFLLGWVIINGLILTSNSAVDPYPFILLNLLLSCISAIQAPIIMMSQNRQAKKDSMRNQNDYKIDLKSELILEELHNKMDLILKNQKELLKNKQNNNLKRK